MSYEIIKSIKVVNNEVFIKSASNNVRPLHFHEWKCESLTDLLRKEGKEALEIEIFSQYENGNFQRGVKKYVNALQVLWKMPEYENFNWRLGGIGKEYDDIQEKRRAIEFKNLLKLALNTPLPKNKFTLTKDWNGEKVYLRRVSSRTLSWTYESAKTKTYPYAGNLEQIKRNFQNSADWKIEEMMGGN